MHRHTKYHHLDEEELLRIEPESELEIALWQCLNAGCVENDRFLHAVSDPLQCDPEPHDIEQAAGWANQRLCLLEGFEHLFRAHMGNKKLDWSEVEGVISFLAEEIETASDMDIVAVIKKMTEESFHDA